MNIKFLDSRNVASEKKKENKLLLQSCPTQLYSREEDQGRLHVKGFHPSGERLPNKNSDHP